MGKYFKRRYGKILGEKYSPNKVYIRSTDVDRTIMSALANSAGLFAPTHGEVWSEDIPTWQPIPVHNIPNDSDYVLLYPKNCPKFDYIYEKYKNESTELNEILTKHKKLLSFLSQKSGMNITSILEAFHLYDILFVERLHNKT